MNLALVEIFVSKFQVVGGMPMKVMVAEPKVRKGSRPKKSTAQL